MGTVSLPGVKSGRGVTLTPHPLLVPWSRKSKAIPLLPLWNVRPVQSLSACTRVHFTFSLQSVCSLSFQSPLPQCEAEVILSSMAIFLSWNSVSTQHASNQIVPESLTYIDTTNQTHTSNGLIQCAIWHLLWEPEHTMELSFWQAMPHSKTNNIQFKIYSTLKCPPIPSTDRNSKSTTPLQRNPLNCLFIQYVWTQFSMLQVIITVITIIHSERVR